MTQPVKSHTSSPVAASGARRIGSRAGSPSRRLERGWHEPGSLQQREGARATKEKAVVDEGLVGEPLPTRDRSGGARDRSPCVGHEAAERDSTRACRFTSAALHARVHRAQEPGIAGFADPRLDKPHGCDATSG